MDELSIFRDLNEAELRHYYEPDGGIFIAESAKVILRALDKGYEPLSLLIAEEKSDLPEGRQIIERCGGAKVFVMKEQDLSDITGYNLTGGFLCAMKRKELPAVKEILKTARVVAVLEDVVNPTNVGAIFRSAAAFSVDAVLLTRGCSDPLSRRAIRVSMGNVFNLPWTYFSSKGKGLEAEDFSLLKDSGFETIAMALKDDAERLDEQGLKKYEKLAILFGTEGKGLSEKAIELSDHKVIIPMSHDVDSLNVAAASAVTFWELGDRRR